MMEPDRHDDLARTGFANGPLYDAARPGYPEEAIAYLVSTLAIDSLMHVVDLGAGTGIFSRQMRPHVARLTAVEPSASMRESLKVTSPGVDALDGSDVAIPLDDHSVDALFAAQAFHWFDAPRALTEIHRVLVPGGGLGLIWNERDESVDWVRQLNIAMQWDRKQPYEVGHDFSAEIAAGPFISVERARFRHTQTLSRDALYQRVLTTSYISLMEPRAQGQLMKRVAKVVEEVPEPVVLPYETDVYSARARSLGPTPS